MKIETIKKKMLEYTDFYGGELLGIADIESSTTKEELAEIINKHEVHMEMMLCDAVNDISRLKHNLGLHIL